MPAKIDILPSFLSFCISILCFTLEQDFPFDCTTECISLDQWVSSSTVKALPVLAFYEHTFIHVSCPIQIPNLETIVYKHQSIT